MPDTIPICTLRLLFLLWSLHRAAHPLRHSSAFNAVELRPVTATERAKRRCGAMFEEYRRGREYRREERIQKGREKEERRETEADEKNCGWQT